MTNPENEMRTIVIKTPRKPKVTVSSYPRDLRGPAQNRYGGHRSQRLRGFKGSKFGPASPVRRPNADQRQTIIEDLRKRGEVD